MAMPKQRPTSNSITLTRKSKDEITGTPRKVRNQGNE
jgi:hypothetical protein